MVMKYIEYRYCIHDVAISMLRLDIVPSKELGYLIVHHPFTNSVFSVDTKGNMLDLRKEEDKNTWVEIMSNLIGSSNFFEICNIMCKPYRLTFLKYCLSYLDRDDIARFLRDNWTGIEFPNNNSAFSVRELARLFRICRKEDLMSNEELGVYNSLPSMVKVYRGVSDVDRQKKEALSWTLDKDVAEWFASRFDKGNSMVYEMEVPKKSILCYFGYEKECIVDIGGVGCEC